MGYWAHLSFYTDFHSALLKHQFTAVDTLTLHTLKIAYCLVFDAHAWHVNFMLPPEAE